MLKIYSLFFNHGYEKYISIKNLMSIKAIECPDGVCHSHHGGHAVPRQTMQRNLEKHGKDWCEKLAERIYEMSVDTYSPVSYTHLTLPTNREV